MQRTTIESFSANICQMPDGDPWQTCAPGRCAVYSPPLEAILGQPCVFRRSPSQEQVSTTTATLQPFSSLWRQPLDLSQWEPPGGGGHPAAGGLFPCELWLWFSSSLCLSCFPPRLPLRSSSITTKESATHQSSYELPAVTLTSCSRGHQLPVLTHLMHLTF